ncbi:hypothetical protein GQ457_10G029680 [Hibiscus cannabinus]
MKLEFFFRSIRLPKSLNYLGALDKDCPWQEMSSGNLFTQGEHKSILEWLCIRHWLPDLGLVGDTLIRLDVVTTDEDDTLLGKISQWSFNYTLSPILVTQL